MIALHALKGAEKSRPLLGVALLAQTGEADPQNQGQLSGKPCAAVHALLIIVLCVFCQLSGLHKIVCVQRLTGGGCGVWTIVDWFLIMGATRRKNYEVLVTYF